MSGTSTPKNNLSAAERLKATDTSLAKMRSILASMDEIDELRVKKGEPIVDEYNGYKRSAVQKLADELEKQREAIFAEIDRAEKRSAQLQAQAKAAANASVPAAAKPSSPAVRGQDPLTEYRNGDLSLALESVYLGLSMDIEKMKDDILQEMKYTYKQDMAIYDDLSAMIESLRKETDAGAIEERIRPLSEKIDALQAIDQNALAERVAERIGGDLVDYNVLADKVAERFMTSGIDYDALARHIVAIMGGAAAGAAAGAAVSDAQNPNAATAADVQEVEKKVESLQNMLRGSLDPKQMPEFRKLDGLISQYLHEFSYDLIPDLLIAANEAKIAADRYIVSGNVLRGETMLSDLRLRLARVNVWGASAAVAVADAVRANNLPVTYDEEAMRAFEAACRTFEQAPALPAEEDVHALRRAKKALFNDTDMEVMDNDTVAEMLSLREEIGETPTKEQIDDLTECKHELMSFNLSYFVDLSPALPPERAEAPAADTQAILDAIARLNVAPASAPAPSETAAQPAAVQAQPLAQTLHASGGKAKPRVLRPAVSAKDNKVEKTDQPVRVVHRKIDLTAEKPDSISKKVVEELALRIANSRVK